MLLETGHTPLWEQEFQRKDGGIFPSELRAYLMRDEEGRPTGAWAFIRDITERKKAEAAKERYLAQLNTLLQVSTSVLSATSMQDMLEKIVYGAIELTGARVGTSGHGYHEGSFQVGVTVKAKGTLPCPPGNIFAVDKGGVFMDLIDKNTTVRLTNKELYRHPRWWGLPEGHAPLMGLLGVSLVGRHGNPRGLIMVTDKSEGEFSQEDEILLSQLASLASLGLQHIEARDETEKKAREAEEGRQKLGVLTQELERSNNDLLQFAYSVAHDLHEPLRTVSSFVQLLSRRYHGSLDAKADEYIAYAVKGTAHMQQLLNDLLAYARVGGGELDLKTIDLTPALERARINLKKTIEESQATLLYNGLPTVHADELQIIQVFQNLIANAIKFHGDEPPVISITAAQEGDEWVIEVKDNGIGIDPQQYERIFLVFKKLHRRTQYPGTGIGLTICKKIVERHGGRIWVTSEPDKGSSFFFSLPARM
jgi:signal transduction histidine kinase